MAGFDQPCGDAAGEVVGGKSGTEEPGQRNADLNGRQESGRLADHAEQLPGFFIAVFHLTADFPFVEGNDGNFRGGKECVD